MNEELRMIVVEALGGECEVLDELWFDVFCRKFAFLLLTAAEEELQQNQ